MLPGCGRGNAGPPRFREGRLADRGSLEGANTRFNAGQTAFELVTMGEKSDNRAAGAVEGLAGRLFENGSNDGGGLIFGHWRAPGGMLKSAREAEKFSPRVSRGPYQKTKRDRDIAVRSRAR